MVEKKKIYCFLGLPASGKGTQAAILKNKFDLNVIGVGDLIRSELQKDLSDPFIAEIKRRYDQGIPQPDEVAIDLVKNYLLNTEKGVIFDNFPFTTQQAVFLTDFIKQNNSLWEDPVIIYVKVNPDEVIKRAMTRKICSSCGQVYGAIDEMICEKCGGSLIVRADDTEETMRTRISHYLPHIKEVVESYQGTGTKVIELNGERSIEEVSKELQSKL